MGGRSARIKEKAARCAHSVGRVSVKRLGELLYAGSSESRVRAWEETVQEETIPATCLESSNGGSPVLAAGKHMRKV